MPSAPCSTLRRTTTLSARGSISFHLPPRPAKGCEWDCVYVLHAADGNIPSDMATGSEDEVEEERRLFYVALTRAKDFLDVCFPLRYYHKKWATGDKHSYAQVTRFLPETLL